MGIKFEGFRLLGLDTVNGRITEAPHKPRRLIARGVADTSPPSSGQRPIPIEERIQRLGTVSEMLATVGSASFYLRKVGSPNPSEACIREMSERLLVFYQLSLRSTYLLTPDDKLALGALGVFWTRNADRIYAGGEVNDTWIKFADIGLAVSA